MAKSPAQLNREIAEALKQPRRRRHHATIRDASDDAWDIAMDAILEHDPRRAAQIWHRIRKEHGFVTAPPSFLKALHEVPADVRWKFEEYVSASEPKTVSASGLPAFYEMVKHPRDQLLWFKATESLKKPGYKGLLVVWNAGDRKPKKAKQSTLQELDISQGYYKRITADKLPSDVFIRFEERR